MFLLMLINTTITTLKKNGFTITEEAGKFTAKKEGFRKAVCFWKNGDGETVACLAVERFKEKFEQGTDYYPGSWFTSLKKAMTYATEL